MRVAVTGAAGFVGRNLVDQLVSRGDTVVAIDRRRPASAPGGDAVDWINVDILDQTALTSAFDGVDVVYHLVAVITLRHNDENAWRINTEGVRNVAEAALAAGVRRMVHCSSIHSFDQQRCDGTIDEHGMRSTDPGLPVYDRSKWAGEQELHQVIARGLDAVICNPTGVYGPADHAPYSRINGMLRDSARGRVPALITGGFDLVDVRDVASGLILAAERGVCGENYLLTGTMLDMVEAFRMAAREAGRRGPAVAFPMSWVRATLPVAEPMCKLFGSDLVSKAALAALDAQPVVDGSKARTELGYAPRSAATTMHDLIEFFVAGRQVRRRAPITLPRRTRAYA